MEWSACSRWPAAVTRACTTASAPRRDTGGASPHHYH
jgi:hypothetical protein